MAALDLETLVPKIRRFCGNPIADNDGNVDVEVYDADIETFIGWAVREILTQLKGKKIKSTYLTTVAGQQLYAPIDDAGEIVEVHYDGNTNTDDLFASVLNPNIYPANVLSGADFGDRSLSLINEIQEREFYRLSRFGKHWDVVEGQICLMPIPSESGISIYYEYTEDTGDISELDDTYERLIYLKTSTYVYSQMIASRSSTAQVSTSGFQTPVTLPDLFAMKDANEKEFQRELQRLSTKAVG